MHTPLELTRLIERYAVEDGSHECALPRVRLVRYTQPSVPIHAVQQPMLCIIMGGRKRVIIGDRIINYGRESYVVASVDLPVVGQVVEASPEAPYLCFALELDCNLLSALVAETGIAATGAPGPGMAMSPVTPVLLDAATRLLRLLDTPHDIPVLAPMAEREILYRLITGEQREQTRAIALADSRLNQVNRAIGWIRQNYAQPFTIGRVAEEARMSTSALHAHFKAVTAMSPLQYQKQIRLQEARQLILAAGVDAATAGHEVGYDSPSQFSREYRRLFGAPPIADAARLRARPELMVGV